MNCAECRESFVSYIEDLLDTTQRRAIDQHLATCLACRAEWRGLVEIQGWLSADSGVVTGDVEEHVMNQIIREQNVRLKVAPIGAGLALRRCLMKSPIMRMSIAAVVILAVGIGIHGIGSGTPTFAAVVRSIMEARTATFQVMIRTEDRPVDIAEGKFMSPGLERQTMSAGDESGNEMVFIVDYMQGKVLGLIPSRRLAMRMELENWSAEQQSEKLNQFEELRKRILQAQENPDESVEYLGESRVDGRKALGYRLTENDIDTTIWADAVSLLPLQVEHSIRRSGNKVGSVVMMNIRFNVPLDPAEFSVEVPQGYTLSAMQLDASTPREAEFIEALRIWTSTTGKFPSGLDPLPSKELGDAFRQDKSLNIDDANDFNDPVVQARMHLAVKVMRGFLFVKSLSSTGIDWHYAGAEAALGDAVRPIFWYRPQGSKTYRMVYADLSVKDVSEDDLPR
jgi:hypothetical protein